MSNKKVYTAIGLMSGTSLDGVDAALIETDGIDYVRPLGFVTQPYNADLKAALRACFGKNTLDEAGKAAERAMTLAHVAAIMDLLAENPNAKPEIVGFHGQTILHEPEKAVTIQIGDAALLAKETGIDVVYDFRSLDVAAGGQGAPLVPLYHKALIAGAGQALPVALLNIGGVGNITWIGRGVHDLIAFDTGTGNALMDDYVKTHLGLDFDRDGALAAKGQPDAEILKRWGAHSYFSQKPPKSLDRNEWDVAAMGPLAADLQGLRHEDALATLLHFTVLGVKRALDHVPELPTQLYLCGGGRHNKALVQALSAELPCAIRQLDDLGWNGDATEGECFAYMAVRSLLGLPISLPSTTGAPSPLTGGQWQRA